MQDDLDEVSMTWNFHRIQHGRNMTEPTGKPAVMHTAPELYDAEDQLMAVDTDDVESCLNESTFKTDFPCDEDFFHLCCELMEDNDLDLPTSPQYAQDLYHALRYLVLVEL